MPSPAEAREAVEAVWRIESARLIAGLARVVGDVGVAEELAQDALVAALERWPVDGVPDKPAAWLATTAKRKAIDQFRRRKRLDERHAAIVARFESEASVAAPVAEQVVEDDLLRLLFVACHPVLGQDARVALTLRLLGGLSTDDIARAYLVPTATILQRITRAKRSLAAARVPFELPTHADLDARFSSVLEVIYLIFNEGYAASSGDRWMRLDLCEEALRLGRVLAQLVKDRSEVHGLVALMELQASRMGARTRSDGEPILLEQQDRSRWNRLLIGRGLAALERARRLSAPLGPYALQASIAACHARAPSMAQTDWPQIVGLYDALAEVTPSPVVELNRAVAVSMAYGPAMALQLVDEIAGEPSLRGYSLLPAVRADLLTRLGRADEAAVEFERAASLTHNDRERALMMRRAAALRSSGDPPRKPSPSR